MIYLWYAIILHSFQIFVYSTGSPGFLFLQNYANKINNRSINMLPPIYVLMWYKSHSMLLCFQLMNILILELEIRSPLIVGLLISSIIVPKQFFESRNEISSMHAQYMHKNSTNFYKFKYMSTSPKPGTQLFRPLKNPALPALSTTQEPSPARSLRPWEENARNLFHGLECEQWAGMVLLTIGRSPHIYGRMR